MQDHPAERPLADGDDPDDVGPRHAEACGRGSAEQCRYVTAITFTQIALRALRRAAAIEAPDTAIPCVAGFE